MSETWTLPELVEAAATRIAALPAPKNGQVRAVPDERTVRYYAQLGLLDRPRAMRGRTALYDERHLAQIVAIKRLQSAGRSLSEIEAMWPTLDDETLARMSGVAVATRASGARKDFWKKGPRTSDLGPRTEPIPAAEPEARGPRPEALTFEIRLQLTHPLSVADVRALRAAAAPLLAELARRGLIAQDVIDSLGTLEEAP